MTDTDRYLDLQRQFWEINDPEELKYNRVDTLYGDQRSPAVYEENVRRRVDGILRDLDLPEHPVIAEIGCGIGSVLKGLLDRLPNATIYGLDISKTMIAAAGEQLGKDSRVRLFVSNGKDIQQVPSASVDLVVCTGVFIHILDIDIIRSYCREAARVLKPGGHFRYNIRYWHPESVFSDSLGGRLARFLHRVGFRSSLNQRSLKTVAQADFNGLYFTAGELDDLTREAGFVPEEIKMFGPLKANPNYAQVNAHLPAHPHVQPRP